MKRALILAAIIVGVIIIFIGISLMMIHSNDPKVMIKRLQNATPDEKDDILLFLNAGRNDAVPAIIEVLKDQSNSSELRADLVELLYKIYHRATDPRIEEIMPELFKDPEVVVRRRSIDCHSLYTSWTKHEMALVCLDDEDPEVRAGVYMIFNTWSNLKPEIRDVLVPHALEDWQNGTNEKLLFFARSILGREITFRCEEATDLLQRSGDVVGAEKILRSALELDPDNHRAKIRLVRHFLNIGQKEKAIELADEYGALLRIPLLPEVPDIDGDPTDEVWKHALATEHPYLTTNQFIPENAVAKTTTYLGHRDGVIYIASIAYEKNLDGLVIKNTIRDDPVFRDDCVEYFFDPDNSEQIDYKFAINAGGTVFDRYGRDSSRNFPCKTAVKIFKNRDYWACEFSLAVKEMDNRKLTSDTVWGISLLRARIQPPSEQCATWPTFGALQMHLFPIAIFEGAPPPEPPTEATEEDDATGIEDVETPVL